VPTIVPAVPDSGLLERKPPSLFPFTNRLDQIDVPDIGLAGVAAKADPMARKDIAALLRIGKSRQPTTQNSARAGSKRNQSTGSRIGLRLRDDKRALADRSIFPYQRKIAPSERPQFRGPEACVYGKYEQGQQCR
jgi:hypothetical protein